MAIAKAARTIKLTAVNEAADFSKEGPVRVIGMTVWTTGATAGQRLQVRDGAAVGQGNVIGDWVADNTVANGDMWGYKPPTLISAISVDNNTFAGTFEITVFLA